MKEAVRTGRTVTLSFFSTKDPKDNWHGVYDIVELGDRMILKRGGDNFEIHAKQ